MHKVQPCLKDCSCLIEEKIYTFSSHKWFVVMNSSFYTFFTRWLLSTFAITKNTIWIRYQIWFLIWFKKGNVNKGSIIDWKLWKIDVMFNNKKLNRHLKVVPAIIWLVFNFSVDQSQFKMSDGRRECVLLSRT